MKISAITEDPPSASSLKAPVSLSESASASASASVSATVTNHRVKPVEVVQNKFNWYLVLKDSSDEALYRKSLKELFNFQTFLPTILVFVVAVVTTNLNTTDIYMHSRGADLFFIIASNTFHLTAVVAILIFTMAQFFCYMKKQAPPRAVRLSKYILRNFLNGHIEDLIIICYAFSDGFKLLLTVGGTICAAPGNTYDQSNCSQRTPYFPQHQLFHYFTLQLVLTIFLKCRDRFVSMSSMVVLVIFMIIAIPYGGYDFDLYSCITAYLFLLAMYEYERFQLLSFLLTKEALLAEKSTLEQTRRDAADQLDRRTNQALLQQILPPQVAKQLLSGKQVEPEKFEEVTIFFSDVVGFTDICAQVPPIKVVKMLNELYTVMDYCTAQFPLYKVETIGDAYMLVGGLPTRDPKHAQQIADFALLVRSAVQAVKSPADGRSINIRIGMHSGSVMAGVVGNLMPRYCLFGDTVNTASRMESNGEANRIHCSATVANILLASGKYVLTERGEIPIKGKGLMTTFWLDKASDANPHANDLAIAKMEVMVHEILESTFSHDDEEYSNQYDDSHLPEQSFSFSQTSPGDNSEFLRSVTAYRRGSTSYSDQLDVILESNSAEVSGKFETETASFKLNTVIEDLESGLSLTKAPSTDDGSTTSNTPHVKFTSIVVNNNASRHGSFNVAYRSTASARSSPEHLRTHSNPNALHSIRYNVINRLSDGDVSSFSSTGAKILVVEDSSAQRKMMVQRLKFADPSWDVSQALNGEDALAKLKASRWRFDVVLVDQNLSLDDGLTGHELVALMRRQSEMSTSVIIACTSNPSKSGEDLLSAGVDHVWPKPPPAPSVMKPMIDELLMKRIRAFAAEQHHLRSQE